MASRANPLARFGRKLHGWSALLYFLLGLYFYIWHHADFFNAPDKSFGTVGVLVTLFATTATFIEVMYASTKNEILARALLLGDLRGRSGDISRLAQEITSVLTLIDNSGRIGAKTVADISRLITAVFPENYLIDGRSVESYSRTLATNGALVNAAEVDALRECLIKVSSYLERIGRVVRNEVDKVILEAAK
jgi:hypothetical protein